MRRKDREMDAAFALSVIDRAPFCALAFVDDQQRPYSLPLSVVRIDQTVYFHTATGGFKIEQWSDGQAVHLHAVVGVQVPQLYTAAELDEMTEQTGSVAFVLNHVFTTEYASAMATGRLRRLPMGDERYRGMKALCEKYTPDAMAYFDAAYHYAADRYHVYAVDLDSVTGKRKKFDHNKQEMKWGRMTESPDAPASAADRSSSQTADIPSKQ